MDKIQNLHDLEYYGNMQLCTGLVQKWIRLKPDNKELQHLCKALTDVAFYVNRIQGDLKKHQEAISDYRDDKNRALLELQELKQQSKM
tara:strand:+ start:356 stop:619 length:264 start_codon:yes stop_codon:yes gene_type:complete